MPAVGESTRPGDGSPCPASPPAAPRPRLARPSPDKSFGRSPRNAPPDPRRAAPRAPAAPAKSPPGGPSDSRTPTLRPVLGNNHPPEDPFGEECADTDNVDSEHPPRKALRGDSSLYDLLYRAWPRRS